MHISITELVEKKKLKCFSFLIWNSEIYAQLWRWCRWWW